MKYTATIAKKNLLATQPSLAKEWHPTKNKSLTPKDVTRGTNKKVWWQCSKGHEWRATVSSRSNGHGCPYCSSKSVCDDNCLQTIKPDLSKQWHPTKNKNLTPKGVTAHSNKKVWWRCSKGHEWQATVYSRTDGNGCPYCSGKAVCDDNCLQTINPALAKEWHPTKNNKLTPKDVTPNSDKKVWWRCSKGHEWQATVSNRTYYPVHATVSGIVFSV